MLSFLTPESISSFIFWYIRNVFPALLGPIIVIIFFGTSIFNSLSTNSGNSFFWKSRIYSLISSLFMYFVEGNLYINLSLCVWIVFKRELSLSPINRKLAQQGF